MIRTPQADWSVLMREVAPLRIHKNSLDGSSRIAYPAQPISWTSGRLVVRAQWTHTGDFGDFQMDAGTPVLEYFSPDLGYSVIRLVNRDDRLIGWYCDLCVPPRLRWEGREWALTYVDLELDVFVTPNRAPIFRDFHEFEDVILPKLDPPARMLCRRALAHLLRAIRRGRGPFGRSP